MTTSRKPTRTAKRPRASAARRKASRATGSIRWSKVVCAQTRIASGYYDRDDVQAHVVDAVLRELKRH